MKKVDTDVEKFAAKIADKLDNPTMHKLAKAFPEKSYRELEIYKNADRKEEANRIPLTESQKKQEDLEPIEKGVCVTGELRKARENDRIKATRRIRGRSTTNDPGSQKGN